MKIFYSWQMDAPRKINKDFVRGALDQALGKLVEDPSVSDADREELEIDQDTQNVLGSPEIARVILDKIAASDVIVTDVSLVASGKDGKRHINSNVAIELGYAYGRLSDRAVLKVMNTHFGKPGELPFDLRGRRHPVQFHLEPASDAETIASEQKKLAHELAEILKLYLHDLPDEKPIPHVETPCTTLRGMFWLPHEPLIPAGEHRHRRGVHWNGPSLLYFRCIPTDALAELSSLESEVMTAELVPLFSDVGFSRTRNKWGALSHCVAQDGDLMAFSQVFRNREIWSVDPYHSTRATEPEDEAEESIQYLPTGAVNRIFPRAIDSIRKLASNLGYGNKYEIEMGISGAEGLRLSIAKSQGDPFVGPIHISEVFLRRTLAANYPIGSIMNDFWELLFSEAGSPVPSELEWAVE